MTEQLGEAHLEVGRQQLGAPHDLGGEARAARIERREDRDGVAAERWLGIGRFESRLRGARQREPRVQLVARQEAQRKTAHGDIAGAPQSPHATSPVSVSSSSHSGPVVRDAGGQNTRLPSCRRDLEPREPAHHLEQPARSDQAA